MSNILCGNLYDRALLAPVRENPRLNNLYIVSGYATAAMAFRHLSESPDINVNLIYGMAACDGVSLSNHKGFCRGVEDDFADRFTC